jgi:hypothetical protein
MHCAENYRLPIRGNLRTGTHYTCTVSLDKQGKKSSATLSSQSHSDGSEKTGYGGGGVGGWSFEVGQVRWNHVDRQAVPSNDGLNI